ncbi:MAG TPA: hypothetical protein VF022_01500 [Rhodanobacteraceae bacterium]
MTRNDTREWLFRAFKLLAIAALVVMLAQPETWAFVVYFLDAGMLDVLAVLLLQVAVILVPVLQQVLKPVWIPGREWLAQLRNSQSFRPGLAAARTLVGAWSGQIGATAWLWMHGRSRELCRGY